MTPLRQRFNEDMTLKGLSERTRDCYTKHVHKLAHHYMKSPDVLSEEDLRGYFLHMKNVKRYSECFFKQGLSAVKFLFEHTLARPMPVLGFVIPRKERKLPDILSVAEVRRLLSHIRIFRYRAALTAIYSLGLRLGEGISLRVRDIDSGRKLVHVHHGKGAKDRFVPLPDTTLSLLREFWKTHRNPDSFMPATLADIFRLHGPAFGEIGFMAVLHTWTRDLRYHPHVHCVIPGGGIVRANGKDGAPPSSWVSAKSPDFFIPVKPLSRLFKAKMRHELRRSGFFGTIPSSVWSKEWVVHIQPAGTGREVVQYLAPYVFRTALSNKRIVALRDGHVTFKFKKRGSKRWSYQTVEAVAFIKRFMRHVLPKGLVKVRYYGFMAPNKRKGVAAVRAELEGKGNDGKETTIYPKGEEKIAENAENKPSGDPGKKRMACSRCGGELIWVRDLPRVRVPP